MDTVRLKWNGGRRFVATDEEGHGIVMDAPPVSYTHLTLPTIYSV